MAALRGPAAWAERRAATGPRGRRGGAQLSTTAAPAPRWAGDRLPHRCGLARPTPSRALGDMPRPTASTASPALSVIPACVGAVGPRPDLVLSGINHGVNVGRSALHSGTVGAALTASQLGISALAVSLRVGDDPDPWESAADLAVALVPRAGRRAGAHRAQPQRSPPPACRDPRPALGPGERRRPDQVGPRIGNVGKRPTSRRSRDRLPPRRPARSWRASRTRRARSC